MKNRQWTLYYIPIFSVIVVGLMVFLFLNNTTVVKNQEDPGINNLWNAIIAQKVNEKEINLIVDNEDIQMEDGIMYMTGNMELMIPRDIVTETFDCAQFLSGNQLVIQKGSNRAQIALDSKKLSFGDTTFELVDKVIKKDEMVYIPKTIFTEYLGYEYVWDSKTNTATFTNKSVDDSYLPQRYSYYDEGRNPVAEDQGELGTCWAFATLTALESSIMPEVELDFSEDHMVYNNASGVDTENGGDYHMSMAYLAGWMGPVLDEDDPYGDGQTDSSLRAEKHLQEAQIIPSKDYEQIKEKVFKYGGVETSFYMSLDNANSKSIYYNKENSAYCYIGDSAPNHEVVIIGWDDNYPKEYFNDNEIEDDGAFICINSWGTDFGEEGIFYVSYYDSLIGDKNICYTLIEDADNYDNIYQADLCGWTGTVGYAGSDNAYFANVFTAEDNEKLSAVGFYATTTDVEYEVFICENYKDKDSLNNRNHSAAKGVFNNSGYYTIELDKEYEIKANSQFAVIVKVHKENNDKANLIPIEMANESITEVDLSDGEGYISESGHNWQSAEKQECNICLKAYTNN